MPLQYTHTELNGGVAMRLVPAPQVSITKNINRNSNGEVVGQGYTITLNGTILPQRGNPTFAGTWTASGHSTTTPSDDAVENIEWWQKDGRTSEPVTGFRFVPIGTPYFVHNKDVDGNDESGIGNNAYLVYQIDGEDATGDDASIIQVTQADADAWANANREEGTPEISNTEDPEHWYQTLREKQADDSSKPSKHTQTYAITENMWMESLLRKERLLRQAFSRDGGLFEIITLNSELQGVNTTLFCRPRVASIDFEGGQYVTNAKYTIQLEADFIYGLGDTSTDIGEMQENSYNVMDSSESWNIEESDEHSYFPDVSLTNPKTKRAFVITHNISATGKPVFSSAYDGKVARPGEVPEPATIKNEDGTETVEEAQEAGVPHKNASPYDTSVGGHAWQQARGYVLDKLKSSTTEKLIQKGAGLVHITQDYLGSEYEGEASTTSDAASDYRQVLNPLKQLRTDQDAASKGATDHVSNIDSASWSEDGNDITQQSESTTKNYEEKESHTVDVIVKPAVIATEADAGVNEFGITIEIGDELEPAVIETINVEPEAFNPIDAIGVFNSSPLSNYWQIFNHVRTQTVDEKNGTFSVDETFIIVDASELNEYFKNAAPATEEISVDITESVDGNTEVGINGTITGLETMNPKKIHEEHEKSKFSNALAYWEQINDNVKMSTRATNLTGVIINNVIPTSKTTGFDPKNGSINYSFSFDDRAVNVLPGSRSESVTVNDTHPGNMVAEIPVIGRSIGPVLQFLGSNTSRKRSLTVEATFNVDKKVSRLYKRPLTYLYNARDIAFQVRPDTKKCFDIAESESWNPKNGTYSYNCEWVFEVSTDFSDAKTNEANIMTSEEYATYKRTKEDTGEDADDLKYIYEMEPCDQEQHGSSLLFRASATEVKIGDHAQAGGVIGKVIDGPYPPSQDGTTETYTTGEDDDGNPVEGTRRRTFEDSYPAGTKYVATPPCPTGIHS